MPSSILLELANQRVALQQQQQCGSTTFYSMRPCPSPASPLPSSTRAQGVAGPFPPSPSVETQPQTSKSAGVDEGEYHQLWPGGLEMENARPLLHLSTIAGEPHHNCDANDAFGRPADLYAMDLMAPLSNHDGPAAADLDLELDSCPPATLVLLPDGCARLYAGQAPLTAADVLADYPGHILTLLPNRAASLLPDAALLPHNTYYLHPSTASLAATSDLLQRQQSTRRGSTRTLRRRGMSCEFLLLPTVDQVNGGQGAFILEEDVTLEGGSGPPPLQKRSTFPGPQPLYTTPASPHVYGFSAERGGAHLETDAYGERGCHTGAWHPGCPTSRPGEQLLPALPIAGLAAPRSSLPRNQSEGSHGFTPAAEGLPTSGSFTIFLSKASPVSPVSPGAEGGGGRRGGANSCFRSLSSTSSRDMSLSNTTSRDMEYSTRPSPLTTPRVHAPAGLVSPLSVGGRPRSRSGILTPRGHPGLAGGPGSDSSIPLQDVLPLPRGERPWVDSFHSGNLSSRAMQPGGATSGSAPVPSSGFSPDLLSSGLSPFPTHQCQPPRWQHAAPSDTGVPVRCAVSGVSFSAAFERRPPLPPGAASGDDAIQRMVRSHTTKREGQKAGREQVLQELRNLQRKSGRESQPGSTRLIEDVPLMKRTLSETEYRRQDAFPGARRTNRILQDLEILESELAEEADAPPGLCEPVPPSGGQNGAEEVHTVPEGSKRAVHNVGQRCRTPKKAFLSQLTAKLASPLKGVQGKVRMSPSSGAGKK